MIDFNQNTQKYRDNRWKKDFKNDEFFQNLDKWNPYVKDMTLKVISIIQNFLKDKKALKILDIGWWNAYILKYIINEEHEKYLVDISEIAINNTKNTKIKSYLRDINIEKLPFEDNSFDFIISTEVIEHIFNYEHYLKEINRVLKINWNFLITTPNLTWFASRITTLLGEPPVAMSIDEWHIRVFRYSGKKLWLKQKLENAGFKIKERFSNNAYFPFKFKRLQTFFKIPFLSKINKNFWEHLIILCKKS